MATGKIESGQMQLRGVGGVPMPQIQLQEVDQIASRVRASGNMQFAQVLDRMSSSIFGDAQRLSSEEGLQFAAKNELTSEQLMAARSGKPIDLGGNNFSAFGSAVRKARSLELANHFEAEGYSHLVDIQAKVEEGVITSEQARVDIEKITNGLGAALAENDGDAAYKFRAGMATNGRTVLLAASRAELQRKKAERLIKFDMTYRDQERLLEAAASEDPTNFERLALNFRVSIATQSATIGDAGMQAQYAAKVDPSIRNAKINAISKIFMQKENLTNSMKTLEMIDSAQAGGHSAMLADLHKTDSDAVVAIRKNFMDYSANYRIIRDDEEKMRKQNNEKSANSMLVEYYSPGTSQNRKSQIGGQLARMNVLSIEQMEKFLDPSVRPGDKYVFSDIKTKIVTGSIDSMDQLKREAQRSGMNGEQYSQLADELLKGFSAEKSSARKFIRSAAGVPDVASTFASKDDQHKIDKDKKIEDIWVTLVDAFRADNPGATIPYMSLAREASTTYDKTDKADAKKEKARSELATETARLAGKGKVNKDFVIDANTSVDDLRARGIIEPKDAKYIQDRINILRGSN